VVAGYILRVLAVKGDLKFLGVVSADPEGASVYVGADGVGAVGAPCEGALEPDAELRAREVGAEEALGLRELAFDDHLEDLVVGDAGAEGELAFLDVDWVGRGVPRLKSMRQVTW
jgi:hypothetical protein